MSEITNKSEEQKVAEAEVRAFAFSTGYGGHDMREGYRDRPVLKKPFRSEDMVKIFTRLLSADRG